MISLQFLIPIFVINTLASTYPFPSVSKRSKASLISITSSSVNPGFSYYFGLNPLFFYIIIVINYKS